MRDRHWSPATIFRSCFGLLFDSILRLAWLSTRFTSMSAITDLFSAADSLEFVAAAGELLAWFECVVEYCGKEKKSAKSGDDMPFSCCCWWVLVLFWASRVWRCCSSFFTKFIAPPIIDAWSAWKWSLSLILEKGKHKELQNRWTLSG